MSVKPTGGTSLDGLPSLSLSSAAAPFFSSTASMVTLSSFRFLKRPLEALAGCCTCCFSAELSEAAAACDIVVVVVVVVVVVAAATACYIR